MVFYMQSFFIILKPLYYMYVFLQNLSTMNILDPIFLLHIVSMNFASAPQL
jgi:hypothetical protein